MVKMDFFKRAEVAVDHFHKGNHRQSADEYYAAFIQCPSYYHPNRFQIFHGYTSILKEEYFAANDDDLENLRKVLKDKHEPRLYRIEAGLALGLLLYTRGDRFETSDVYYKAMEIGERDIKAKEARKEQTFKVQFNTGMQTMKSIQDEVMSHLRSNHGNMTGKTCTLPNKPTDFIRSDGSFKAPKGIGQQLFCGEGGTSLTQETLTALTKIGGVSCDYCHKKASKEVKLFKCTRCNRAFYCSTDCQRRQWKERNHKKYCREAKCFEAGDLVLLHGLKSKPELNNSILRVVGPADGSGNNGVDDKRWELRIEGHHKSMSIAAKNMNHLRPYDVCSVASTG